MSAGDAAPDEVLDCRGQRCPLPVIKLARRLPELPVGAVLRVLADDPAAAVDIPAWCRMRAHDFLAATAALDSPAYDVRRAH
ncbi:sulfurtransferase TusA family protein [Micromonospora olivasterospora]|uniref:tRNA 2-thiouridine synthesizing protein A n=1 Tax=Micromonospora olivasterospora TaxID=1880 RepID=A0A562I4N9_MICOL|nr:sulfurtransferase TusA family protein [Micromonospora olivasterospora]TWH65766.1 tRNA 2-thiouridine synthesizing protein A [Micromonospora olivasterospora]